MELASLDLPAVLSCEDLVQASEVLIGASRTFKYLAPILFRDDLEENLLIVLFD